MSNGLNDSEMGRSRKDNRGVLKMECILCRQKVK